MRVFKLIGVAALMLVLSAIAVGTASASVLPGTKGTTITGSSGKATLQVKGGATINCTASTTKGEVLSTEESLVLITFTTCSAFGLAANSVGDAAKTILVHVEAGSCSTEKGAKQFILFKLLPVVIEIPSTKLTLEVTGDVLGVVTPANKKAKSFTVALEQKEGKQAFTECEVGGKKVTHSLLTSVDAGTATVSGQEAVEGKLEFSAEQEFMG
jgi:hypothetical protein